ncbi:MAG: tetratricopeptide repeat protein [Bacteroidales bacterium]|nr:tetratricopeptide repeat protein [Bacteroidales bacterium]
MNALQEALAEGQLSEAIALVEATRAAQPQDAATGLLLAELLLFAGRFSESRAQLDTVESSSPDWPAVRRGYRRVIRAECHRSERGKRPLVLVQPIPRHLRRRWQTGRAIQQKQLEEAETLVDRADQSTPFVMGHVDGRELEGLRDADDRLASVLELFIGGTYAWVPWEAIQQLRLAPSRHLFDTVYRSAELKLQSGQEFAVVVPLLYPASYRVAGSLALGLDTDWIEAGRLSVGVGAKTIFAGEEELLLRECTQFDFRT